MDVLIHWRNFTIFYSEGDGAAVFSHCWFYPEADCILSRRRCIYGCCLYSFLILLCLLFYFSTLPHYRSSLTIPLLSVLNLLSKLHHWSARGWVNSAVPWANAAIDLSAWVWRGRRGFVLLSTAVTLSCWELPVSCHLSAAVAFYPWFSHQQLLGVHLNSSPLCWLATHIYNANVCLQGGQSVCWEHVSWSCKNVIQQYAGALFLCRSDLKNLQVFAGLSPLRATRSCPVCLHWTRVNLGTLKSK